MKRMICMLLSLAVMIPVVYGGNAVFADNGEEYYYFCDFEGYSAAMGSGIVPDENWGTTSQLRFGSEEEEDGNTAFKLMAGGEALLFFGQMFKSGRLHVSFDIKFSGDTLYAYNKLYDGRNPDDARTLSANDNYSMCLSINPE